MKIAALLATFAFATATYADTIQAPGATWEYTFSDPTADSDWNNKTGQAGWLTGAAPFSNVTTGDFAYNTYWAADTSRNDDLWGVRTLDFTGYDLSSVTWSLGVDNGYVLYLNGVQVGSADAGGFTLRWEYTGNFSAAPVNQGVNILAFVARDYGGLTAFDMIVEGRIDPNQTGGTNVVPEPGTLALFGLAAGALVLFSRRRR